MNRAELYAFHRFLAETKEFERVLYIVDSSYVVKGVARCVAGLPHSSHSDLWKLVAVQVKGRDVVCIKVESHLSVAEVIAQRVAPGAYLANRVADVAAGKAAEQCQLPYGEVEGLHWAEALASSVRARCAAAFLSAVEVDDRAPPPALEGAPDGSCSSMGRRVLAGRIAASQHEALRQGSKLYCSRCKSRTAASGSRQWLASPCVPGDRVEDGFGGGSVRIARREVHASHDLRFSESLSLHFCISCGSFSRASLLKNLSTPCRGYVTRGGRCALRCIERGRLPSSLHVARTSRL